MARKVQGYRRHWRVSVPGHAGRAGETKGTSSASLLYFNVFSEYELATSLLRQAYQEVMEQQMEEGRLRNMPVKDPAGKIIIRFPEKLTPFCFPTPQTYQGDHQPGKLGSCGSRKMISEE